VGGQADLPEGDHQISAIDSGCHLPFRQRTILHQVVPRHGDLVRLVRITHLDEVARSSSSASAVSILVTPNRFARSPSEIVILVVFCGMGHTLLADPATPADAELRATRRPRRWPGYARVSAEAGYKRTPTGILGLEVALLPGGGSPYKAPGEW
jgi:hypothetical protein